MDLPDDRFIRMKYSTEMFLNYLYFVLTERSNELYCGPILKNQLRGKICACVLTDQAHSQNCLHIIQ